MAARSTRPGHTGPCWSAATTPSPSQAGSSCRPCSISTTPPTSCPPPGGVKEQLRRLLKTNTVEHARQEKIILIRYVLAADMVETWRLWSTVDAWWPAIEVLIATRVTNARTEAANTGIKQIKRTGRGYRNPTSLPSPYPAPQRRQTRGVNTLTSRGTTVQCE